MIQQIDTLPPGKKIYFASDFHLGAPDQPTSLAREQKIIRWLESIRSSAAHIFLLGDIFDFWFEYRHVIPKGFIRFQGKLAELADSGLPISIFTGNHDMWIFDYFTKELGVSVYHKPQHTVFCNKQFLIGHGDGLGPGDHAYKVLKVVFRNKACQWLFDKVHPMVGMSIAQNWSNHSKKKGNPPFQGEEEWIWKYCQEVEQQQHHDYYIFGHRHLPLDLPVGDTGRYINLGEWMNYYTYAQFDGNEVKLLTFE